MDAGAELTQVPPGWRAQRCRRRGGPSVTSGANIPPHPSPGHRSFLPSAVLLPWCSREGGEGRGQYFTNSCGFTGSLSPKYLTCSHGMSVGDPERILVCPSPQKRLSPWTTLHPKPAYPAGCTICCYVSVSKEVATCPKHRLSYRDKTTQLLKSTRPSAAYKI